MTNRDVSTEKKASGVFYIFDRSMENRINPREDFWWSMELNGQKNGMGIDKSNRIKNKENKRGKIVNKTRT